MNSSKDQINPLVLRIIQRLGTEPSLQLPDVAAEALLGQSITLDLQYGTALNAAAHLISPRELSMAIDRGLRWVIFGSPDSSRGNWLIKSSVKMISREPGNSPMELRIGMKRHKREERNEVGQMICEVLAAVANNALAIALEELGVREPPEASNLPGLEPFTENDKRYIPLR